MSRMTHTTTPLAVAADYADALITARRAKNWLFFILMLLVLAQMAVFLLAKFNVLKFGDAAIPAVKVDVSKAQAATQPAGEPPPAAAAAPATQPTTTATVTMNVGEIVRYATPIINFAGIALSMVLMVVLLLLVTIMLVGRLVGVSHVTGAFIWCVLLIVVLFPWQTFLISNDDYRVTSAAGTVVTPADSRQAEQPAFKWPGALYTWAELHRDYDFKNEPILDAGWKWGRYVGLPVLAMLLLFMVQSKSGRGLRYALGESELHVELTSRGDTMVQ